MIKKYLVREKKRHISETTLLEVIRHPIATEKSMSAKARGEYFFAVASWANKITIARAVESVFGVKVKAVNTLNAKGKRCRFKGREGTRSNVKKAMVSLEGDDKSIDLGLGGGKPK